MSISSFMPQLCNPVDVVPTSTAAAPFVAHLKFDGWRAIGVIKGNKNVHIQTRNGNAIDSVPYLNTALENLPEGTVIDGEIHDPTQIEGGWNRVQTICSADTPHQPSLKSPALVFEAFDVLFVAGEDVRKRPLSERLELLRQLIGTGNSGLRVIEDLPSTPQTLETVLAQGHEGLVVKRLNAPYVGGRSNSWVKLKPTADASTEAEIIGFTKGNGAFADTVGALRFRLPSGVESQCSGFDMAQRKAFAANPLAYVGTVVEIAHWGVNVSGSLRHPQFRALRPDRSVAEMKANPETLTPTTAKSGAKPKKPRVAKTSDSAPRMRNYKAMGDAKLIAALASFKAKKGDAYDRCLNGGSGQPEQDLKVISELAVSKGLA